MEGGGSKEINHGNRRCRIAGSVAHGAVDHGDTSKRARKVERECREAQALTEEEDKTTWDGNVGPQEFKWMMEVPREKCKRCTLDLCFSSNDHR